jgi:hypothetical protein
MLRRIRLPTHSFLSSASHKFFATHRRLEGKAALTNVGGNKPFDESTIVVQLSEDEESGGDTTFTADEEPHFLKPELGYGYNPLNLGERLQSCSTDRTYEIVRKLGFGGGSSVWLGKFSR